MGGEGSKHHNERYSASFKGNGTRPLFGKDVDMGMKECEVQIPSTRPTFWKFLSPIIQPRSSDPSSNLNMSENEDSVSWWRDSAMPPRDTMSALLSGPLSHLL